MRWPSWILVYDSYDDWAWWESVRIDYYICGYVDKTMLLMMLSHMLWWILMIGWWWELLIICLNSNGDVWWLIYDIMVCWYLLMYTYKTSFYEMSWVINCWLLYVILWKYIKPNFISFFLDWNLLMLYVRMGLT